MSVNLDLGNGGLTKKKPRKMQKKMLKVLRIIRGSIPYGSMANELTVFSVDGCVIQQKIR